jgi:probable phosphoglycerate mutase
MLATLGTLLLAPLASLAPFLALPPADALDGLGAVPRDGVRVYLVRHGQAFSNLEPRPQLPPEQLDRLTDLGRSQSLAAGGSLRAHGIGVVLSSPANRARETADGIRSALGDAALRIEPRLRPLGLGQAPDGRALQVADRRLEWDAGRDPAPPQGESLEQVGRRVLDLVTALRRDHAGRSVVLVSHGEVIACFLGLLRGAPPSERFSAGLANGSLTVVDADASGAPRLRLANHVPTAASR